MNGSGKLFVVGLPRTGTKSTCYACERMGMVSMPDPLGEDLSQSLYVRGRIPSERYHANDVFGDVVISAYWRTLARSYPYAQFILTIRDPVEWLESIREVFADPIAPFPIRDSTTAADIARWCGGGVSLVNGNSADLADEHIIEAVGELANRLLVLDVAAPQAWDALARFVGREPGPRPFPRINLRSERCQHSA